MTFEAQPYADLEGVAMAPAERFGDRELYERAIAEILSASADGPDWTAAELVLTEARLDGSYPDTALFVSVASARTGEQLLRRGFFIWHDTGREKHVGDTVYRAAPAFYVAQITTTMFEALIIRPDK